MSERRKNAPIQMYQDPDDWIVSYSSPFANYVYEQHPENPNYWVAVRMKTAEEMATERAVSASTETRKKARSKAAESGDAQRTALYRLRDSDGALLYVGISAKPPQRWGQHSADKEWWPEVVDLSLEWFDSKAEALAMETHAIRTEQPRYNVRHNSAAT